MKPRNERERECMRLSAKLPQITSAQIGYAIEHCFSHKAAPRSKKYHTYYCLDCGETIKAKGNEEVLVCPKCGHKLTTDGERRKIKETSSFQVITTIAGYQVVRTWYFEKITQRGKACDIDCYEVTQRFMKPGQKDTIIARCKPFMSLYYDAFDKYSPLSIKYESTLYYNYRYDIFADAVYPRQSVLPELKRNGYSRWLKENYKFSKTYHRLIDKPQYETLAKALRFDLWDVLPENFVFDYWPQIKMLMRHDYHPHDLRLWVDTVGLAKRLGLDIYSPKYVLPANLTEMHDSLNARLEAIQRREEEERRIKEEKEKRQLEREFKRDNAKLLAMVIVEGDITIKPLQNYDEFVTEGKKMHHCVATYWGRKDSFILSARSGRKRLATIELDRNNFSLRQCRAACNEVPERYDEIVSILNDHRKDFVNALRRRTKAIK